MDHEKRSSLAIGRADLRALAAQRVQRHLIGCGMDMSSANASDRLFDGGLDGRISQSLIADYAAGRLDRPTAEAFEFFLQQNADIASAVAEVCGGITRVRSRLALNS